MIGFRVDANEIIASGHVMRCLSIADALFSLREEVVFFTADEYAEEMIRHRGYNSVCLHSKWDDKDGELGVLVSELKKNQLDLLIVDSYQVTPVYLETIRKVVKLAYIDDLNSFDYPVDMVINYSVYAEEFDYPANKQYLLGTKYVPLRKQFDISEEKMKDSFFEREKNKRILVTTGASDPYRIAKGVVDEVLNRPQLSEYKIEVIKGRFWDDSYSRGITVDDRVTIRENVDNMAEIMLNSTLAVSAGGSTLYELCACRVPTVTVSYADNQLRNVNGFLKRGIMGYAGDARSNKDLRTIVTEILLNYHSNNDIISDVEVKMESLGCGQGALRLAKELLYRGH